MTNNNSETGNSAETNIDVVKEKQRKKHYGQENPIVESEAYTPKATDTDADGNKESYDVKPEVPYPFEEGGVKPKPKKKPAKTLPF